MCNNIPLGIAIYLYTQEKEKQMKKELQFNQIVILFGLCMCFVGLILTPIVDDLTSNSSAVTVALSVLTGNYITTFLSIMLIVLLGGTFIFAKNIVVKNVGYGLCAFSLFFGLPQVVNGITYTGLLIFGIGTIFMAIGSILYLFSLISKALDVY